MTYKELCHLKWHKSEFSIKIPVQPSPSSSSTFIFPQPQKFSGGNYGGYPVNNYGPSSSQRYFGNNLDCSINQNQYPNNNNIYSSNNYSNIFMGENLNQNF